MIRHRNGQPLPAVRRFDPVAVLPFILLVLNRAQQHKDIGPVDLIEIAEPWQILRLMNGENHLSTWDGS